MENLTYVINVVLVDMIAVQVGIKKTIGEGCPPYPLQFNLNGVKEMKLDYPELEGTSVALKHESTWKNAPKSVLIAGCSYHVGITLVNADNKENEIVCLNRDELVNVWGVSKTKYRKMFQAVVNQLTQGYYVSQTCTKILYDGKKAGGILSASCAFR